MKKTKIVFVLLWPVLTAGGGGYDEGPPIDWGAVCAVLGIGLLAVLAIVSAFVVGTYLWYKIYPQRVPNANQAAAPPPPTEPPQG